jgi:hypothetical protein
MTSIRSYSDHFVVEYTDKQVGISKQSTLPKDLKIVQPLTVWTSELDEQGVQEIISKFGDFIGTERVQLALGKHVDTLNKFNVWSLYIMNDIDFGLLTPFSPEHVYVGSFTREQLVQAGFGNSIKSLKIMNIQDYHL